MKLFILGEMLWILSGTPLRPPDIGGPIGEIPVQTTSEYENYASIFPELPPGNSSLQMGNYYSYDQIVRFMEKKAQEMKTVKVISVGRTTEGRDIKALQIGQEVGRRFVVIDAGIHAREWTAIHVGYYLIERYTSEWNRDRATEIKRLLSNFNIVIVPVLNPDGYIYTREEGDGYYTHRLWRKNRSIARCDAKGKCCGGVDLNRNWNFQFGERGTNVDPCSDIYPGPFGFSSSETKTYSQYLSSLGPLLSVYFTLHSHGQLWLYPYAYASDTYSEDIERTIYVTEKALDAIYRFNGTRYVHGTPGDILYPSSGSSMDWVKNSLKTEFVFALEVRPLTESQYGFIIDRSLLIPASEEVFIGVNVVLETALEWEKRPFRRTGSTPIPRNRQMSIDRPSVAVMSEDESTSNGGRPRAREQWELWLDGTFAR